MVGRKDVRLIIYVGGGAKQLQAEDVIGPAWAPSDETGKCDPCKLWRQKLFLGEYVRARGDERSASGDIA